MVMLMPAAHTHSGLHLLSTQQNIHYHYKREQAMGTQEILNRNKTETRQGKRQIWTLLCSISKGLNDPPPPSLFWAGSILYMCFPTQLSRDSASPEHVGSLHYNPGFTFPGFTPWLLTAWKGSSPHAGLFQWLPETMKEGYRTLEAFILSSSCLAWGRALSCPGRAGLS